MGVRGYNIFPAAFEHRHHEKHRVRSSSFRDTHIAVSQYTKKLSNSHPSIKDPLADATAARREIKKELSCHSPQKSKKANQALYLCWPSLGKVQERTRAIHLDDYFTTTSFICHPPTAFRLQQGSLATPLVIGVWGFDGKRCPGFNGVRGVSASWDLAHQVSHTDLLFSYEALPPNFSILQNCAAGAFAGIAVRALFAATPYNLVAWLI